MKEIITDELNHLEAQLEKLEKNDQDSQENNWLRGYYMGQISAFRCALKMYEIEERREQQ